jgi:hypothetical protein
MELNTLFQLWDFARNSDASQLMARVLWALNNPHPTALAFTPIHFMAEA